MENLENFMTMPRYEYESKHIPDDIWADMESNAYDDMVFEEMIKE